MTNEHPITPSRALLNKWVDTLVSRSDYDVFIEAAQWGADRELEACCEWLDERTVLNGSTALRIARRPKPPTLKEQALALLHKWSVVELRGGEEDDLNADMDTIRKALEALPND